MKFVQKDIKIDKFAGRIFSKFVTNIQRQTSQNQTQYFPNQLVFSSNTNPIYPTTELKLTLKLKSTTTGLNPIMFKNLIKNHLIKLIKYSSSKEYLMLNEDQKLRPIICFYNKPIIF